LSHSVSARAIGVGAVAAAALLVAGCGSSHASSSAAGSSASSGAKIEGSPIARAADVSGAEKGEKIAYTLTETLPSIGKITATGTGAFNQSPAEGQMSMKLAIPSSSSLGAASALLSNLQLQFVIKSGVFYIKVPTNLTSELSTFTGGKPWVEVNFAQLASGNSSLSSISGLLNGTNSPTDPSAIFKEFQAASTNGVTKVGTATINGVATTEYKANLDFSKLSSALPASQRAAMQKILAQASKQLGGASMPVTLYIDSANLVRRVVYGLNTTAGGQKLSVAMQMDFLAYGQQSAPSVPSTGQTFNLDGLISKYSGAASSASTSSLFGG
jgi:hypothetical protein